MVKMAKTHERILGIIPPIVATGVTLYTMDAMLGTRKRRRKKRKRKRKK